MNKEIYEKLKSITVEQLEIEANKIKPESLIFKQEQYSDRELDYFEKSLKNSGLPLCLRSLYEKRLRSVYGKEEKICYSDFGCDKSDFIELIMAVEEEFDIEITDKRLEQITTVKDLHDVVFSSLEMTA